MRDSEQIRKTYADGLVEMAGKMRNTEDVIAGFISLSAPFIVEIAAQLADAQVSLRDRFAMAAMSSMTGTKTEYLINEDAEMAYKVADAMLKERDAK